MNKPVFKRATRQKLRGRIAIDGPSGSGKTFTALRMATALGKKIAVINSESGAIQKYLGLAPDGIPFEFDVLELDNDYSPARYTEAILMAGQAGYDVLVIDSLSHAWEGIGGALEMVDKSQDRNKFGAWRNVTPLHNRMVQAILHSPCHVIATMRSKTEYVLETDPKTNKQVPRKVGMAPVQRSGMEYEFDIYCSMDWDHVMTVTKTRCPEMDGLRELKPSAVTFERFTAWLNDGSEIPASFFAATEEDLKRFDKAEESKKPQKSGLELAKELAAAEQATAKEHTPKIVVLTADQASTIHRLWQELGVSIADQQKQLAKRGVNQLSMLSAEQAAELIEKLESRLPSGTIEYKPESTASGAESSFTDRSRSTEQQADLVRKLIAELPDKKVANTFAMQIRDQLAEHGRAKFADITAGDCNLLIDCLKKKDITPFLGKALDEVSTEANSSDIPF